MLGHIGLQVAQSRTDIPGSISTDIDSEEKQEKTRTSREIIVRIPQPS
jgi:hypothetical protein